MRQHGHRRRAIKTLGVVLSPVLLLLALAFWFAPSRSIETSTQIAAPPSIVWAILTNTANYPAWNPQMRLHGQLKPGNIIRNQEGLGSDARVFWPIVQVVSPNQELSWKGNVGLPRLFDADHRFQLSRIKGGTLFTQSEKLQGILLWFFDVRQLLPAFQAMDTALKTQAEMQMRQGKQ